jgi:glucose-1-phosphate cytidylyltransferase
MIALSKVNIRLIHFSQNRRLSLAITSSIESLLYYISVEKKPRIIILAGGLGTRISEETTNKPKPMVLIADKPILWHIMNIYAQQGFNEFLIATGYKGEVISEWVSKNDLPWNSEILDTGLKTQTGGRIKMCMEKYPGERMLATYGDGLGNINILKLVEFHKAHGKLATLTAVRPPARFGHLDMKNGQVLHFGEKNQSDAGWINGGYFLLEPEISNYINSHSEPFETGALPKLAREGELMAFEHGGFWQPMDTLREKQDLEKLAQEANPPWLIDI